MSMAFLRVSGPGWDVDAFLRRLVDVLLDVDREEVLPLKRKAAR